MKKIVALLLVLIFLFTSVAIAEEFKLPEPKVDSMTLEYHLFDGKTYPLALHSLQGASLYLNGTYTFGESSNSDHAYIKFPVLLTNTADQLVVFGATNVTVNNCDIGPSIVLIPGNQQAQKNLYFDLTKECFEEYSDIEKIEFDLIGGSDDYGFGLDFKFHVILYFD